MTSWSLLPPAAPLTLHWHMTKTLRWTKTITLKVDKATQKKENSGHKNQRETPLILTVRAPIKMLSKTLYYIHRAPRVNSSRLLASSISVSLYEFFSVDSEACFPYVLLLLWLLHSFCLIFLRVPWSLRWYLMETYYLELWVPRTLSLSLPPSLHNVWLQVSVFVLL